MITRRSFLAAAGAALGGLLLPSTKRFFLPPAGGWRGYATGGVVQRVAPEFLYINRCFIVSTWRGTFERAGDPASRRVYVSARLIDGSVLESELLDASFAIR